MIGSLTQQAARKFGDRVAIIAGKESLTFAEIEQRVSSFAGGLQMLGVGVDDRVVLHLPNGWRWIVAYYAIVRLGAVVVPANILLSIDEVAYIATDSQAVMVISTGERCAAVSSRLANGAPMGFVASDRGGEGMANYEDLLSAAPAPAVTRDPGDLCSIGYTSGTTGRPKGAMLSHRAIHTSATMTATMHARQEGEVVVSALPLPHVYGNIVLHCTFLCGMTLVVMERFAPATTIVLLGRYKATLFEGVPTMYHYLLNEPALHSADLSTLRRCTVGGQTMPTSTIEAVEAAFGCPLLELWGMTEVAGPAISHSLHSPSRHGSIGLPFPGMEVRVADMEDGERDAPDGEAGELLVRGPLVMDGYYNNPDATKGALSEDGWLKTGDVVRRDRDGYLYVLDRKKDMIITAGYNIYPAELEQVIAAHPAVAMVAVAGIPDQAKGELAKAFVVLKKGASLDAHELFTHCRGALASYKVPRHVEFVESLPTTSTGKVMRRALREASSPSPQPSKLEEMPQ
ncbi:MAG: class I adenylate-forming enzyme family protein [Sphingobium phenoxybenzoativorans]|uniref:class I adenylate-forming enzyme family protein n=1 Tax=Sphingobium phenoxybenzoativorans TaxID=1592790 RepID=UPI000871EFBD|nr:AMP-binding protein [Sphingobium phenoxybenzoativorans]